MTIGSLQYGTSNNAGTDETILTSTVKPETLSVMNSTFAATAIRGEVTRQGDAIVGVSNGCGFPEGCNAGVGVRGMNVGGGIGVAGTGGTTGVEGSSRDGTGVSGFSTTYNGVRGNSETNHGVRGESTNGTGLAAGVFGRSGGLHSNGVIGEANNGSVAYGVWGRSTSGYAGYFSGKVTVTGTLFKGGGGFRIDHPLDPENKYLSHSFVESPDMLNVYNGNVTTDDNGNASVMLPDYFEALNQDFRYQLTVIGQFAQAIVAEEIRNNQFTIKTDKPNVKVSWQVTGIRKDLFAEMYRVPVEENKSADEIKTYLDPEPYGKPKDQGVDYAGKGVPRKVQS